MPLTDVKVKTAKVPSTKNQIKLSDGGGLQLWVNKNGKYWRLAYRFAGKQKVLALGVYPQVSLKSARLKRDKAKSLLDDNIDPAQQKKANKQAAIEETQKKKLEDEGEKNTLEVVGRHWFELHRSGWVPSHAIKTIGRLERHLFPAIGSTPIAKLQKHQVAKALEKISSRGTLETAQRIAQLTRNILVYAMDTGLIDSIPMGSTKNILPAGRKQKPMPSLTAPKDIGKLLRAIDGYRGTFTVCCALKLLPYLAVRAGEFRRAEWGEFDFKKKTWTIPAAHRKLKLQAQQDDRNVHQVPLCRQSISILKGLYEFTGSGVHVFPSSRGDARPMSENTINTALHAMGYKGLMVGHGWRSSFSTMMNQQGFNPDAIERQLAHTENNAVRAAYNRADYMEERIKMMQCWADYLDKLKAEI